MNSKLKKVGNVILDILVIAILVISLTVVVMSATSKKNGVSNMFGYTFLSVKTDSMEPTIKVGDLIIGRISDPEAEYEIGDVVTFKTIVNQTVQFNTHRIAEKQQIGNTYYYSTKGDNSPGQDDGKLQSGDIIATWEGTRIPYVGGVLNYLRSGVGFFIFLMIPVILFFLFYLYKFIKNLVLYNKENAVEAAKEAAAEVEEDQKKRIIEEYLAAQKAKEAGNKDENDKE